MLVTLDCQRRNPTRLRTNGISRRRVIGTVATGLVGVLAGCSGRMSFPDADVIGGPDGRNVFEPAELTVSVGQPVTWGFESSGHNVCCRPSDHDDVELPDDAEPFSSYRPDESPEGSLVPRGETYEHAIDVPGTYHYVCIPHASVGMQGTIRVE